MGTDLEELLGDEADSLLNYTTKAFPSEGLVLPGRDYLSRVFSDSDRSPAVLRNLGQLFNHGRLGGTRYVSILPVELGMVSRKYVHRIPFIVKLNHNQFLHYPNTYDQILFGSVQQAFDLGASGVGATIYFRSDDSHR